MDGLTLVTSNSTNNLYCNEYKVDNDWESLISEGLEARELKDKSQWRLGELADKVDVRYGMGSMEIFSASIGVNKRSLLRYRDVWRGYRGVEIIPALSFSHYMKALGSDNPEEWLRKAYEGNWSVEKLGLEISLSKNEPVKEKSDTPRKCSKCSGWIVTTHCNCD